MSSEHASAEAQSYDTDELATDLRTLLSRIEEIHPDPYHGYSGRVALHRAFESTIRELPETATEETFYRLAAELVAGLEDAHSRVVPPEGDETDDTRLPISLRLVGDAIYVDAVFDDSLTGLLGARLLAVDGESVEAMAERYAALRGSENRYFARKSLAEKIESAEWLGRLLGEESPPASVTCQFQSEGGVEQESTLTPISSERSPVTELEQTVDLPSGTGPRYRLHDDGQTALLVPGSLSTYREVIQALQARDAGSSEERARAAYREHNDGEPPEDIDEILPHLPSMTETLIDMVQEMAAAETETLVVDLRDNPGGDSRFAQYIGYVLFGWERIVEGANWTAVKRRSEHHRAEFGVPDAGRDEFATFEANPAAYDFGLEFRQQTLPLEQKIATHRQMLGTGAFADELDEEAHAGYYEPENLVVVTTAGTMSSAFAGGAGLADMGADVVGVPSGQAPLSFGEAVEVELPNTGLSVDIAGSMFEWTEEPEHDVLPIARELTPTLFEKRYDKAGDAALRLAFDHASGQVD
jgi:hypothetical protein